MKCIEIRDLLSLYIDNMLDEDQVREVEEHLSSCDACRKEYNELNSMLALIDQAEMIPVPDEFSFRLKKALKEEKQKMIDEGLIKKQPAKKNQWRIITSIAAVFAVGILSYGLYDNVMGGLPFFNNASDQVGPAAKTEKTYPMKNADPAGETGVAGGLAEDAASSSDGSVVMKGQADNLQPMTANMAEAPAAGDTQRSDSKEKAVQNESAEIADAQTYGAVAGPEPDGSTQPANGAEQESAADTGGSSGSGGEFAFKSSMISSQDACSRSLTGSGLERNSAAVQYYNKQIEEKLSGFDYQVLETTYSQTGEWQFRIFIFRGKDGNTYNEEIKIIGKDGKIETICSNDFMGL